MRPHNENLGSDRAKLRQRDKQRNRDRMAQHQNERVKTTLGDVWPEEQRDETDQEAL